jgi:hypothetical protein
LYHRDKDSDISVNSRSDVCAVVEEAPATAQRSKAFVVSCFCILIPCLQTGCVAT